MSKILKNSAYIDAANLHKGALDLGWELDYRRFRSWLREKYQVDAVIVSSDGDYAGLVSFLIEKNKLEAVLSPSTSKRCSILLKRTNAPILFLNEVRSKIDSIKEKAPGAAGTAQGSFS